MKQLASFSAWPIQNQQLEALYHLIEVNKIPHAILLVGDEVSTQKLAEYLAKLFLCSGDSAPCGSCESCRQFAAGTHPDYIVAGAGDNGSIRTVQIEEIQFRLKVRSHHGTASVYLLKGVDAATPVAANRLLKTLEEPSGQTQAILTTAKPGRLMPTIRSRLFAYSLDTEGTVVDPSDATVHQDEGDAFVSTLEPVIEWTYSWLTKRDPSLVLAATLLDISGTSNAEDVLDTIALWLRELVHSGAGLSAHYLKHEAEVRKQAQMASLRQFSEAALLVTQAKTRLQAHVAANLNFEQLCIRLRGVL